MVEPQPILDREYWAGRLLDAKELHHAIFKCSLHQWEDIERKHREILAQHIQPKDTILDAGCAWGRLLSLLPEDWEGKYLGVDLSPEFIDMARQEEKGNGVKFECGSLEDILPKVRDNDYDWGILVSIRPMIVRNLGEEIWRRIDWQLHRCCKRLLFLEYDVNDEGSVEE